MSQKETDDVDQESEDQTLKKSKVNIILVHYFKNRWEQSH